MASDTFARTIFKYLRDKTVEVYSGDSKITRNYSQETHTTKDIVMGRFIDVGDELIILEIIEPNTLEKNLVFINTWNVKTVVEPKNGLSTVDIYTREHQKIKK